MKKKDSHITELFKKYFGGKISRIDQRRLDEIVMVDDYARDAKEGGDQLSAINRLESFQNLESRMEKRLNKSSKRTPLVWLKLAAGIAILVSAGMFIWQPFGAKKDVASQMQIDTESAGDIQVENNSQVLRRTYTAADGSDKSDDLTDSETTEVTNVSDFIVQFPVDEECEQQDIGFSKNHSESIAASRNEISQQESSIPNIPKPNAPTQEIVENEVIIANDNSDKESYAVDGIAILPPSVPVIIEAESEPIAMEESDNDTAMEKDALIKNSFVQIDPTKLGSVSDQNSRAKKQLIESKLITGTVTDENGEPLIGASVFTESNTKGTSTDIDGTFSLKVDQSTEQLVINYIGYENHILDIGNKNEFNVQLSEPVVLSEVIIASARKDDSANSNLAATPIGGMSQFKKYLQSNLVYPAAAKQAKVAGKVVLLFNVNSSGRPDDIEVKKSLGYGCDEEAIRLLVMGPDWEQGSTSGKTRVVIRFR